jgi:hypothetical protein
MPLPDTQSSLANQVEEVGALEDMIAERDSVKREVIYCT